jgi:hypothetical protein
MGVRRKKGRQDICELSMSINMEKQEKSSIQTGISGDGSVKTNPKSMNMI